MEPTLSAWTQYLAGFPADSSVRDAIVASWERSGAAHVEPHADSPSGHRVDDRELAVRKAQSAALLDIAIPHLEWISAYLGARAHVVYLVDADGIVLFSTGTPELLDAVPLSPGHDWSEAAMGTNGAGTALATGAPVAVIGPEHCLQRWHDCACTGAPIRGPGGHILGAIDVTTANGLPDPERLAVVSHVAWTIERELDTLMLRDRLHSQARLRRVIEAAVKHLPNAMIVASVDRTFVCASRGAEMLLDEEGVGIDLQRVSVSTADGRKWTLDEIIEHSRRGEHVDLEGKCLCSGDECSLSVCATPLWDGAHIVGVIIMFAGEHDPCGPGSGPCSCRS